MTEDEAKTKWCPYARSIGWIDFRDGEKPATENRDTGGMPSACCLCIGSKCMAWRISERARPADIERKYIEWRDGEEKPSTQFEELGWVLTDYGTEPADEEDDYIIHWEDYEWVTKAACPAKGYCGLAGKP